MDWSTLFDLEHTIAGEYLVRFAYPWEALPGLKDYIKEKGRTLGKEYREIKENVWVHESATVDESASVTGPAIIGEESEVRHCALIRGGVLIGRNCVVGNSTELKNVILFDGVQTPHYNYVGDSILGTRAHMGAGAVISNLRCDKKNIAIRNGEERIETGMRKVGAFLGDRAEIGCNCVINPGSIIGRDTILYPLTSVSGVIPPLSIVRNDGSVKERRMD